jgi:hypothetical protein
MTVIPSPNQATDPINSRAPTAFQITDQAIERVIAEADITPEMVDYSNPDGAENDENPWVTEITTAAAGDWIAVSNANSTATTVPISQWTSQATSTNTAITQLNMGSTSNPVMISYRWEGIRDENGNLVSDPAGGSRSGYQVVRRRVQDAIPTTPPAPSENAPAAGPQENS